MHEENGLAMSSHNAFKFFLIELNDWEKILNALLSILLFSFPFSQNPQEI